ncbi:GGDEF domain-containing protein [Sphingomonas sp. BN140010]|uniref:GGDEF domain-containing protein n=1 Tax=Sphingomonas arvum TaxID=2992113 RepID=A0ABT3JBQ3_9SPHN|nr:GGDEF domain-containing protein [Sphingomonas sp. BN140010]MCW3796506.1 GGDEF domain-containing protein [Sphingomonas sp. BN140010]
MFDNSVPMLIMSVLFILAAVLCSSNHPNLIMRYLGALGVVLSLARPTTFYLLRRRLNRATLVYSSAKRIEIRFGYLYLAFASVLGLFAAAGMWECQPAEQPLFVTLIVGYAAGAAASVSLRPWIAYPSQLAAVCPSVLVALAIGDAPRLLLAGMLLALLLGSFTSVLSRYRGAVDAIEIRYTLSAMARTDPLTGLANRVALQDAYQREIELGRERNVAIHCLDLDGFKPINDAYGHLVGDMLLAQVAARLRGMAQQREIAVRLGGDEFVFFQPDVEHRDEVDLMARRLKKVVSEPYDLGSQRVVVGVSAGFSTTEGDGLGLYRLLEIADEALYIDKALHSSSTATMRVSA